MKMRHAMLAVAMLVGTVLVESSSDPCLCDRGQNSVWAG